jgi:hypothetical protein
MNNSDPIKEEITVKLEMWRLPEDANARPAYDVAEEIISAMKVIASLAASLTASTWRASARLASVHAHLSGCSTGTNARNRK